YDPMRPFGPPHASATGVYLEGLIDAYELALEVKDFERTNLYRRTIKRGLRSVLQLQFSDEIDMFYVSHNKRNLVFGGLRTTVYDNEIRCDNVQHCLMAAIKIIGSFSEFDYN
ncbi:MAG: hypothetical protein K9G44_02220, partial [Melioribacteraceae bacterium]|nr:hypothetical protein [Melioribacteraceae bacterium]